MYKRFFPRLACALAMALVAVESKALDPQKEITQYVHAAWQEQLPHNTVMRVLQTSDGYIWAATYEGLARFNGAEFATFDKRNTKLESSAVATMAEDTKGRLWIGTVNGGLYRFEDRTLVKVPIGDLGETVFALAADRDGSVWVSANRGLGRIVNGKLQRIDRGIPKARVWALYADGDGDVWLGTEGGGLVRHHAGQFTTFTKAEHGLTSDVIFAGRGQRKHRSLPPGEGRRRDTGFEIDSRVGTRER